MADSQELKTTFENYLAEVEKASFSGWNFDFIYRTGRMSEAPVKWNYYNVVLPQLAGVKTMLDMGTGGGEMLSEFKPLPPETFATEPYHPNAAVAKERLEPLGVKVMETKEEKEPPYNTTLPFEDNYFGLIINRHEAYYPPELKRILKPGGTFVTQQVANVNCLNLVQFFLGKAVKPGNWNLKSAVDELKAAGFGVIEELEDITFYRFYDIGAITYFLEAIPWTVPGFSIDKYRDELWELHLRINRDGYFDTPRHRFLVVAKK